MPITQDGAKLALDRTLKSFIVPENQPEQLNRRDTPLPIPPKYQIRKQFNPPPDTIIRAGDCLIVIADVVGLKKLEAVANSPRASR